MSYQLVIDPETKEEKYEWVDRTESSADQQRREIKERRDNAEPFDLKEAAIGTAKAVPRMFINAGINAVQEGSDTIRDIGGYMGIGEGTTFAEPDKPILGLGDWKPKPLESSGIAEDIGTGILQFGLEWVMLSKALRLANWGLKATPLAKPLAYAGAKSQQLKGGILKTVGKSPVAPRTLQDLTKFGIKTATATSPKAALVDFAGFDQYEGRLYDLAANSNTWFNNVQHIPLINQLATNPEDEGLRGRFKNALEGAFIDLGIGGVISARSAAKVIDSRIKLNTLLNTPKNSPDYARVRQEAIQAGAALEQVPEIQSALTDRRVLDRRNRQITQTDRRKFDQAFAHKSPEWREAAWKKTRESLDRPVKRVDFIKERKVKVEGDLQSIRQQIDELGPEPPKPGKGQARTKDGKWTPAYRRWDKWNRRNKSLQARQTELTTLEPSKPLPPSLEGDYRIESMDQFEVKDTGEMRVDDTQWYDPEGRPIAAADASDADLYRNAFMQRARDIADGIESGDLPYFYGKEGKTDETIAAQIIEGRSISQIIEKLKTNIPKATVPIGEAKGITLSNYRSAEKIIKRLKDQVGKQGFTRADRESVEEFIDTIGRHMFDDVAFSFNSKIGAPGQFSFNRKLIEIRSNVIKTGKFDETMIHELWHSLSRYLPASDLKRYFKEWKNARKKYEASMKKKFKFWEEDGTPSDMKKMKELMKEQQTKANAEVKATGDISEETIKEIQKIADHSLAYTEFTEFLSGKGYTKENYRFADVDEYFAEMLTDHFMLNYTPVDFAPKGTFRRLVQEIGIFFKELWIEIHARLGPHNTEKIFNDYLKGRNKKQLRKYSLETYFDPDQVERIKEGFLSLGIQINEAAQEFNVIHGSVFDEDFVKRRVEFEPDEMADLSDFIRSFEDPTYDKLLKKIDDYLYPEKGDKAAPYPINEKDGERIDDLLDILQEEDPRAYKEWEWMRDEPVETSAERQARTDAEDEARFQEESRLYEEQQARQEASDDPRGFYEEDARAFDEAQARRTQEPAGGKRTREEVEGAAEDVLEAFQKVQDGDADMLDTPALWQDVTTLRSPKGRDYYPGSSAPGGDFEKVLDAFSHRFDRIIETGMPSISSRRIAQELGDAFRKQGINVDEILHDESIAGATEIFSNNVENITNLLKIRFGLNFTGGEAAKWAIKADNAINNPSINREEALGEMIRHLETALQFSRVYQIWTRHAGELLQSAQAQIKGEGITETVKRQNLGFDKVAALSEASKVSSQVLVSNLPEEFLTALRTGEWTPRAEAFAYQLTMLAKDADVEHGLKTIQDLLGANEKAKGMRKRPEVTDFEKISKGLSVYYVNNLLSAAKTWAVQTSGLLRTAAEPAFNSATAALSGDLHRARIALLQYNYIVRSFYGSLKLGKKAWDIGQSLYDPKIRTAAWASDAAGDVDINTSYAQNRAYQMDDPHPSYDLNTSPFVKEASENPGLFSAHTLWKLNTWNIRGQLALDTLTKSLAGNSLAHVVGIEEGLMMGKRKGLKGAELSSYAEQWAAAKIEFYTFDAIVNGETIADAIMKDEAALQIGRILTFTDQTRARMPGRTYAFGEELAKARGMVDEGEIDEFAKAYRAGELEGAQKKWNRFIRSADGQIQNAKNLEDLPMPGELTPTLTSGWSQIPQAWGKLQARREGAIYTFIQPFNRSPGDITKQWVRMIPGLNMTVDTFYRDLFNENAYLRNRWKSEVAIGTTVSGLFAATVLNNEEFPIEFTGYGPNNPTMRKEWTDGERPPLSWRTRGKDKDGNPVYGKWRSYRAFEPAATFIAGLADYKMLYNDLSQDQKDDLISGHVISISAQVMVGRFNATYYKGITEFLDAIASAIPGIDGHFNKRELEPSERNKLSRYVQRLFTNFIPESGRLREVSRAMDRYKRTIDSGVNPIVAFDEADEGLVKQRDELGRVIYLKKADAEGEDPNPLLNFAANYFRQQLDEIKNTIPGFSETLPERINWVTGLPVRNAGFLGSNDLPLDDAPWLSRLTGAYFGTLKGAVSEFGVGAKGHSFDPRLKSQKSKGVATYEYKASIVNDEMIKMNRAGAVFPPPRPTDFGKGIRLSPPAFRKYKEYIYTVKLPAYGGKTLTEALYSRITAKDYQANQDYVVHPTDGTDGLKGFKRFPELRKIINDYKHAAKEEFRKDGSNEYRMEVTLIENRQRESERIEENTRRTQISLEGDGSMELNAQDFAASINR